MTKIDKTVLKETRYIAYWVIALSIVMEVIFVILNKWDITVLSGNILSAFAVVLNFLLMGITVQRALSKDPDSAKTQVKLSQMYRMLLVFVIIVVGVILPWFNVWSVVIPVIFPRIAITFRPLFDRR